MTLLVTLDGSGNSTEATGHPTECTEPVPGTVGASGGSTSVTVRNASGDVQPLASTGNASLQFPTHSHEYKDTNDDGNKTCTSDSSHDITPSTVSSSITINGSPVFIEGDGVATDPASGGSVNILDGVINNSLTET